MYFYDDMKENIESVSARKDITSVWVINRKTLTKTSYVDQFRKRYPYNKYVKIIDEKVLDTMTIGSGLSIEKIKQITYKKAKVVIFDWDLTLSIFNGTYVPHLFNFPKDIPLYDIAQFYAGSSKRFEAIQKMFSVLRERRTRVYILTNNGWGQHPTEFIKLLRIYDPKMKTKEILYGNLDKLKKINQVFTRKKY